MFRHRPLSFPAFALAFALLLALPGLASAAGEWAIDEDLKFHFAYLAPEEPVPSDEYEEVPAVAVGPAADPAAPDITNIDLDAICGLGFPLPNRHQPGKFTLYLKFFRYPEVVCSCISTTRVTDGFWLHRLSEYPRLRSYLVRSDNLLVKKAFIAPTGHPFSAAAPYPPLLVPRKGRVVDGKVWSGQAWFDGHLPFLSLYLTPAAPPPAGISEEETVAWSGMGVLAFHRDLLDAYERNLEPVPGQDDATHRYFRLPADPDARTVTILKVPREPMIFTRNWRDLPMPQDPRRVFLSALLLVFRHEYEVTGDLPPDAPVDGPAFQEATRPGRAQVLEVGSVVRLP